MNTRIQTLSRSLIVFTKLLAGAFSVASIAFGFNSQAADGSTNQEVPYLMKSPVGPGAIKANPNPEDFRYSVNFTGGTAKDFMELWKKSGFSKDSILFSGSAQDRPYLPPFKVKAVRIGELAKSLEFVSNGELAVQITVDEGGVIWKIGRSEAVGGSTAKSHTCAMPSFFSEPDAIDRLNKLKEEVLSAMAMRELEEITRGGNSGRAGWTSGNATRIESEKVVVLVGTEHYVETMTSALEAVEKISAMKEAAKRNKE